MTNKPHSLEIDLSCGKGSVKVDGVPIQHLVTRLELVSTPGEATRVTLELMPGPVRFKETTATITQRRKPSKLRSLLSWWPRLALIAALACSSYAATRPPKVRLKDVSSKVAVGQYVRVDGDVARVQDVGDRWLLSICDRKKHCVDVAVDKVGLQIGFNVGDHLVVRGKRAR